MNFRTEAFSRAGATSNSLPQGAPESPTCRCPPSLPPRTIPTSRCSPWSAQTKLLPLPFPPIGPCSLAAKHNTRPSEKIVNHQARAFAQELWRLIRLNRELGLPPSIVLYKRLTVAIGKVRGLYDLRLVLPAYLSEGLPLCRSILDAIINACGKSSSFEYAWVTSSWLT